VVDEEPGVAVVGLLDAQANVLTTYKANVDDHVRKLDQLGDAEKKHKDIAVAANKEIGHSFTELHSALELLHKGYEFAKESLDEYTKHTRLAHAAAGIEIEKLHDATRGLRTEMDLLSDAAKFNHAQFALNTEQMAIAERAMIGLTRRGFDAADAHTAVMNAAIGLRTRGLEQMGIWIDKTGDSMNTATGRADVFKKIMAELAKVSGEVKDGQLSVGESVTASSVRLSDAWAKVKESMGELVKAAAPLIVALSTILAKVAGIVAQAGETQGGGRALYTPLKRINQAFESQGLPGMIPFLPDVDENVGAGPQGPSWGQLDATIASKTEQIRQYYAQGGQNADYVQSILEGQRGQVDVTLEVPTPGAKTPGKGGPVTPGVFRPDIWDEGIMAQIRDLAAPIVAEVMHQNDIINAHETGSPLDLSTMKQMGESFNTEFDQARKNLEGLHEILTREDRYAAFQGKQSATALQKIFGPVGEFDLYKHAFESLTGAVGNAMKAWIEGSESAGRAFKSFIGQAVEGLAVQMGIEALKFGAYAIGSLVPGPFFNPAAAAGYATTAAEFAAGAAIAAVAARELGHGGKDYSKAGGAGKGGGAGSVPPSGGGGWGTGGSHVVYVIGDPFGEQTSRQRANGFKRQARAAIGDAMGRAS
jgi:hypothetical protein